MSEEEITLSNIEGRTIDNFLIMEQFSSGGFSHVHFAEHLPTRTFCAAKVIDLSIQNKKGVNGILREISVFMQIYHPNIVSLYKLSQVGNLLIFFQEYATNGTLLEYVNKTHGLMENEARRIFRELFSAIRHVHYYHFLAHRDLKLENILLDKDNNVKLIDFGLAGTFYCNTLRTFVGTPGYTPPEIIAGFEYSEKCDVWCLGICLFIMLTSTHPFTSQIHEYQKLVKEAEAFIPPIGISNECEDLLKKMLNPYPSKRPSLMQLQNHPWLQPLTPVSTKIAPMPIIFYKINNYSDIMKFKRRPEALDQAIIDKCVAEFNVDKDSLLNDLKNGIISDNSALYYILAKPLYEKPEKPSSHLPPLIKNSKKRKRPMFTQKYENNTGSTGNIYYPRAQSNPVNLLGRRSQGYKANLLGRLGYR